MRFFLLATANATLAFGQVGPDYVRPSTEAPPQFKGVTWREANPASHLPKGEWWKVFADAQLNELELKATSNNQELKAAIARFDQARANARITRGDLFPTLGTSFTRDYQRTSGNMPSPFPLNGMRYHGPAYNTLMDFSWEIDLWGKVRRGVEADRATAEAAADAVHNVLLGIQAEVASTYFQIRALDAEMRVVREAVDWRSEALKIAKARVQAGAGSELEQAQSETEVASAEAEISALQASRDELENRLAILLGVNAASFRLLVNANELRSPPSVRGGVPTDLLERRPDLAQTERQLAAATARIGVAKAQFFPSLKLMGNGGFQSGDMDLLLEPTSLLWTLGPRLSLPLFSGHKNRFNLSRSKSMHEEALAGYRQAFLAAVADVETSLSQIQNYALQASAQQRARASAERAAQLARTRYEAGTSPYLDVIEANRTVLTVQRATIQTSEQRLAATVNLIKAIGGGWDVSQAMMFPGLQSDPAVRSNDRNASPGVFAKVRRWFQTKS